MTRELSPYQPKLRDPRWQKKRLEVLSAGDWKCCQCGRTDLELHVHHKEYARGRDPWEYEMNQLCVLCHVCHGLVHEIIRDGYNDSMDYCGS